MKSHSEKEKNVMKSKLIWHYFYLFLKFKTIGFVKDILNKIVYTNNIIKCCCMLYNFHKFHEVVKDLRR